MEILVLSRNLYVGGDRGVLLLFRKGNYLNLEAGDGPNSQARGFGYQQPFRLHRPLERAFVPWFLPMLA